VFQAHLKYESSKSSQSNNSFHSVQEGRQNNLLGVQNYFIHKVRIIQRWWRSVVARKKAENRIISECKIGASAEDDLFEGENTQSLIFGECCTPIKGEAINTSPIKMVDDFG